MEGPNQPKKKYRATQAEARARRDRISWLRAHGVVLAEHILKELRGTSERPGPFPHATLQVVYKDIEYIQANTLPRNSFRNWARISRTL